MKSSEKRYATVIVACVATGVPTTLAPIAIPLFTSIALTGMETSAILAVASALAVASDIALRRLKASVKAQESDSGETQV